MHGEVVYDFCIYIGNFKNDIDESGCVIMCGYDKLLNEFTIFSPFSKEKES